MQWKLSDDQFIARVRWWYRRRLWLAALLVVLGIAMIAYIYWAFRFLGKEFQSVSETLATAGHPTTNQAFGQWLDNIKFTNGFGLGFYAGIMFIMAIELIGRGLVAFSGSPRKERLLLKLWDSKTAPLNQAHAENS